MAGRALDITQRQVRALCEGAKKAGYAPVVKLGNTLVWLIPADRAIHEIGPTNDNPATPPKDYRL